MSYQYLAVGRKSRLEIPIRIRIAQDSPPPEFAYKSIRVETGRLMSNGTDLPSALIPSVIIM